MINPVDYYHWGDSGHYCDERCTCPIHKTTMIYSPAYKLHACQDINCIFGHGFEEQYMVNRSRRKGDRTDNEGTVRLPHIQKALDAGLLDSPPEGEMAAKGRWGKTKKKRKRRKK